MSYKLNSWQFLIRVVKMLLSELLGDHPTAMSVEEETILKQAVHLWANKFSSIVKESRGPAVKTRIVVRKDRKNG